MELVDTLVLGTSAIWRQSSSLCRGTLYMSEIPKEKNINSENNERGIIEVLVHSFFVIPFVIVVFAVIFFFMWKMLSNESDSAYDYLNEIRIGSETKT